MSNKTRVVNVRYADCDVYIGRNRANQPPNIWGNPFHIGKDGSRAEVIEKYRQHIQQKLQMGKITLDQLKELDGKRLGCWCHPLPCHGDVLIEMIKARNLTFYDED